MEKKRKIETLCVQSGYTPRNGEARISPIVQSTTFRYESADRVADLFDLKEAGFFYTRLSNPTVDALEKKVAALEGGAAAVATASGQAASFYSVINIASAGDNIVCFSAVYGGTFTLFHATLRRLGIEVRFAPLNDFDEMEKLIDKKTKALFGEVLTNPNVDVLDVEKFASLAKTHNIVSIVDNTFLTPYLFRPLEWGVDIVIHSSTKYLDGHATSVGGVIVDGGKFDWKNADYPLINDEDENYHGLSFSASFGNTAYAVRARAVLLRDIGAVQSPMNAFLTMLGIDTLHLRMVRHSENALRAAKFLENHPKVSRVKYPALEGDPNHALSKKYFPKGSSGVISVDIKGGSEAAKKFIDSISLITLAVHVADVRSHALHPASMTHRQLSEAKLMEVGINPATVRLSLGIEDIEDIIDDLRQALERV